MLRSPSLLPLPAPQQRDKCLLLSSKVRDYSGTYTVKLLPCTAPSQQEYRLPVTCNPREPVTFDLDIRFQQVRPPSYFPVTCGTPVSRVCFTFLSEKEAHRRTL